jgi:alcohol dehydrogenase class IV
MSEQSQLRKFVSPEIIFGNGARMLAGRYARQFSATKVLMVTDEGVISAGWCGEVEQRRIYSINPESS